MNWLYGKKNRKNQKTLSQNIRKVIYNDLRGQTSYLKNLRLNYVSIHKKFWYLIISYFVILLYDNLA